MSSDWQNLQALTLIRGQIIMEGVGISNVRDLVKG